VGLTDGVWVEGALVGDPVGGVVGLPVGSNVGLTDGVWVEGALVGDPVGGAVGLPVGAFVGLNEGRLEMEGASESPGEVFGDFGDGPAPIHSQGVGDFVGIEVGLVEGEFVGSFVGTGVAGATHVPSIHKHPFRQFFLFAFGSHTSCKPRW